MGTIADKLNTLSTTKAEIKLALENKDIVTTDVFSSYASQIESLSNQVQMTQAEYDALAEKKDNTLYIIVG